MYIGKERSFLLHSLAQGQEHDEQKNDEKKKMAHHKASRYQAFYFFKGTPASTRPGRRQVSQPYEVSGLLRTVGVCRERKKKKNREGGKTGLYTQRRQQSQDQTVGSKDSANESMRSNFQFQNTARIGR